VTLRGCWIVARGARRQDPRQPILLMCSSEGASSDFGLELDDQQNRLEIEAKATRQDRSRTWLHD
jgi:hypothetical protein